MNKSVSFLLGAGFSAPKGYPIGTTLNNLLSECSGEEFAFHTSGVLAIRIDGKKPDFGYKTSYDIAFDFCRVLIQTFNSRSGYFNYEEFYDFLLESSLVDEEVKKLSKSFLGDYYTDIKELLGTTINVYNQLVAYYLKDRDGKKWYDDEGYVGGYIFPGYTGILDYLKLLAEDNEAINIHTLNHDMLFERLSNSDWLKGNLCDGFEELGSPYYGALSVEGRSYNCRLPRYTGRYTRKFRLYKLHGSLDYALYYTVNGSIANPENYIKTRYGVGFGNFYKEKMDSVGQLYYENCWVNYHADFLTGTTSKIERYTEPLLFNKLFFKFRENLKTAHSLVIIGYGGRDHEVNNIILDNFDYKNKPSYIIDPYPGADIISLKEKLESKLIVNHLENIQTSDFD